LKKTSTDKFGVLIFTDDPTDGNDFKIVYIAYKWPGPSAHKERYFDYGLDSSSDFSLYSTFNIVD
jgi:hypothetical protein